MVAKFFRHAKYHLTLAGLMILFLLINPHRLILALAGAVLGAVEWLCDKMADGLHFVSDKCDDGWRVIRKFLGREDIPTFGEELVEKAKEIIDIGPEGK